ncbi:RING finger protein 141-like [Branchiostoma floridae x Branchiostoma belcheri]
MGQDQSQEQYFYDDSDEMWHEGAEEEHSPEPELESISSTQSQEGDAGLYLQSYLQSKIRQGSDMVLAVQGRLQKHAAILRKIAVLDYKDLQDAVKELNEVTKTFSEVQGKHLVFTIKKGTDEGALWKATVRIRCLKIDSVCGRIESTRLLNLRQFIAVYNTVLQQAEAAVGKQGKEPSTGGDGTGEEDTPPEFQASIIFTGLQSMQEEDDNECCICMDRRSEVILPCTHSFCQECIDKWNVIHNTCPNCRGRNDPKDSWVMPDMPDSQEIRDYLMGVTEGNGNGSQKLK